MATRGAERLPHVTVIVPVKDRREQMLRCMDALLALDYPSFDVLVADNCSSDGTPEACRERAAGSSVDVAVERIEGSLGAVRNAAAKQTRGEVIAFTDSDCLPDSAWLRAGVAPFVDHESVGVVCGCTLPEQSVDGARWPATLRVEEFSGRYEGANLLFRRDAFEASGGFDDVVGHFWEDTAAGLAILRTGYRAEFVRTAIVRHDVTFPGYRWHLKRAWKQSHVGPVLAAYPELRTDLLWMRYFQRPRSALLLAFYLGLLIGTRNKLALLLTLPYLWLRFPRYKSPTIPRDFAELLLFDTVNVAGAFYGGLKSGRLIL